MAECEIGTLLPIKTEITTENNEKVNYKCYIHLFYTLYASLQKPYNDTPQSIFTFQEYMEQFVLLRSKGISV